MEELFSQTPEVAVLSLILKKPELIHDVEDLKVEAFSSTPNQLIFSTMLDLSGQGLVPEFNLLSNTLASNGTLQLAGGEPYLKYLHEQNYNELNFSEFKRLITRAYKAKHLLNLVANIPERVTSTGDVDGTISDMRNKLDSLSELSSGDTTIQVGDCLDEAWQTLSRRVDNPGLVGVPYGFKSIDNITGGQIGGDLIILGARPSMGKTSMVMSSIIQSAEIGYRPLLFSLEMNKQRVVERLVSIISGVDLTKIGLGTLSKDEIEPVKSAFNKLRTLPIFIDTNFIIHPDYISSTVRRFKNQKGITNVWVDYLQLLAERDNNSTHELGKITRMSKLLAEQLEIPIGLVVQLNRGLEQRDDKRPVLSDIRQSGNIEEDADQVMFLYRDEVYYQDTKNKGIMEYIIRKNRSGPVGTIRLKFDAIRAEVKDER